MTAIAQKLKQNKYSVPVLTEASVGQSANAPIPTLEINVAKALQRRRHRKKILTRPRTQAHVVIGEKWTWYNGKEWKNTITQFAKDNQLQTKIKIHEPEYLEAMREQYLERDVIFFEELVLSVAFLRVGSEGMIEKWFWTEEEDFLEAYRLVKMNCMTSPPRPHSTPQSRLEVMNCIQTHFKNQSFTTRQLRPFLNYDIAYIVNVVKELLDNDRIKWIGMNRQARVYQFNK